MRATIEVRKPSRASLRRIFTKDISPSSDGVSVVSMVGMIATRGVVALTSGYGAFVGVGLYALAEIMGVGAAGSGALSVLTRALRAIIAATSGAAALSAGVYDFHLVSASTVGEGSVNAALLTDARISSSVSGAATVSAEIATAADLIAISTGAGSAEVDTYAARGIVADHQGESSVASAMQAQRRLAAGTTGEATVVSILAHIVDKKFSDASTATFSDGSTVHHVQH